MDKTRLVNDAKESGVGGEGETRRTNGIVDLDARSNEETHAVELLGESVGNGGSLHMGGEVLMWILGRGTKRERTKKDELEPFPPPSLSLV